MAVYKCKMCGGALEVNEGMTVCECEYCGTTQTISKTDNEQTINMLNRASHFRQQCEFDKAMEIYERILNSSDKDSEIYWQIVLCRYGIEYVDDPLTKRKIPTCHRTQFKSVLNDADYLEALNHADSIQKDVYIKEAEYIDSIQKGILEISNKEEPFDVFICYKESDENGKRTKDSVLAQDLYYQLEQEGFKVFFSRITLEGKLGTAYEPYIFAALNSSKVMVVVGTKQEYFNAVWVRNEWSRFLMLMQNDKSKTIIPAYKDMDPYDLPDALSMFQAQDMSKLGFMQDLIRGIKKLTGADETVQKFKENKVSSEQDSNTSKLLKRAFIALEDEEWENADVFCEQALNNDPECAEAYIVKLLVELKLKNEDELLNSDSNFFDNRNYKKHYKYSDKERKKILDDFSNEIIYRKAKNEFDNNKYLEASDYFKSISGYKDSEEMSKECIYILAENCFEKGLYSDAESIFKQIPDYKDAEKMAKECLYILATSRFEKDLYSEAESIFKQIPDYKDAEKMAKECLYVLATSCFKKGLYSDAENIFKQIPNYKDANKMAKECLYVLATSRFEKGLYSDAENIFNKILGYKDSDSLIEICKKNKNDSAENLTLNNELNQSEADIKNAVLIKAKAVLESGSTKELKKTINNLYIIKEWKNADELLKECENKLSSKNSNIKTIILKLTAVLSGGIIISLFLFNFLIPDFIIPSFKYYKANILCSEEKYEEAIIIYGELVYFRDSKQKCREAFEKFLPKENISESISHIVGLKDDGTVIAVGSNDSGQCNVSDWTDIISVSAGTWHTVGLRSDGTVIAVGSSSKRQCNVSGWKDITKIIAGGDITYGLKKDGTIVSTNGTVSFYNSWEEIEDVYGE